MGAIGALALLMLFVAGIGYNLARGRQPECHCFGQVSSQPVSWSTLIRNLLLAAVAAFIVGFGRNTPGLDLFAWPGTLALTQRIELIVGLILIGLVALEGWILWQVLRQQGRLLLRIEALEAQLSSRGTAPQTAATGSATPPVTGLPVGMVAPPFALTNLNGETTTLEALRALGKPVVLIFSEPTCGPCTALLPEIGRWQREYATRVVVALIFGGTAEANRPKVTEYGLTHVLLQKDHEVGESYQVSRTPSAVLIRRDGSNGSPLAPGADAIRELIASAVNLPVLNMHSMTAPTNGNRTGAASIP